MDIGIWGDSIVYGACDKEELGWVGRLRKQFTPDEDERSVYNRGICGDTTENLVERFAIEFTSIKPEIVIFGIGINDSVYRNGDPENNDVPLNITKTNLKKLIDIAKSSAQKIYIVGLTHITDSLTQPLPDSSTGKYYSNLVIQKYDLAIRSVAEESGVSFIHIDNLLEDVDLADGLHPNEQGYQKLYRTISAALQ